MKRKIENKIDPITSTIITSQTTLISAVNTLIEGIAFLAESKNEWEMYNEGTFISLGILLGTGTVDNKKVITFRDTHSHNMMVFINKPETYKSISELTENQIIAVVCIDGIANVFAFLPLSKIFNDDNVHFLNIVNEEELMEHIEKTRDLFNEEFYKLTNQVLRPN